jgi:signal transduction histidine kinase
MRLAAQDLEEQGRWLVAVRWLASAGVVLTVWVASSVLGILRDPRPLYAIALCIIAYNLLFQAAYRRPRARRGHRARGAGRILLQFGLDLLALTLLLYFSDIAHNPFILYFVFHVVMASILLPGWAPYLLAFLAVVLVGAVLFLQSWGVIPPHPLDLPGLHAGIADERGPEGYVYPLGVLIALGSTLGIAAYLTTSVSRYVERVQGQIRQHEKMLGIGQLVAGFAHQIANPLDGLQNGLRRIESGAGANERLKETVRLMMAALGRIENVAKRLQEFARPQGLELQACDVNRAVDATLQLYANTLAGRGITVQLDCSAVPKAWGDPYSIEEILFNLCTNALDAMPQGGTLLVRTHAQERPDIGPDGCVAIEVHDSGVGIPADRLEKIFEPFYTTKAQTGGTGLGLGLCRMLLSEMGGRLEVESQLARGSTFRVLLAAAADDA